MKVIIILFLSSENLEKESRYIPPIIVEQQKIGGEKINIFSKNRSPAHELQRGNNQFFLILPEHFYKVFFFFFQKNETIFSKKIIYLCLPPQKKLLSRPI